ncbi:MAG: leucine-rich repeat domain-containing protein, partial [Ruminococcus sp.]
DMFSYKYNDDVIVTKVQDIDVDEDTVTISEKEATLEDAFDYIKIEGQSSDCEVNIDSSNMDEGVSFEGVYEEESNDNSEIVSAGSSNSIKIDKDFNKNFTVFNYEKNWTINGVTVSLKGSSDLKLSVSLDMYYKFSDKDNFYLNTSFKYTLDNNISVNAKLPEKKINIATYELTFYKVVTFEFQPSVVFKADANVSYQITIEGELGIKCNKTSQLQKIYKNPEITKNELKFHGEIYIGLELKPSINIISECIANAYINARVGVRVTADYSSVSSDPQHLCKNCIDGKIYLNIYLGANVGFFMNPITKKYLFEYNKDSTGNSLIDKDYLLSNFYYSFDKGEFGFTTCPNRMKNRFPQCVAQNAYWDVTTDGILTISGTGSVEYSGAENGANSYKTRPWNVSSIKKVVVKEGITKISGIFYQFSSLKSIKLPKSLKYIGNTTFNRCSSLKTVEIPSNVTYIGSGAFFMCKNLGSIKLPKGVTTVKSDTFYHCDQLSSVTLSP